LNNNGFPKALIITAIEEEANDVKLFYLRESDGKIEYQAGQYLTLLLPKSEVEVRRSYSLVSSPATNEQLCIAVKRIINGIFSRYLYDRAQVGDQLLTIGAGGLFVLPESITDYSTLFFFAAGSGIVPVYSLIKTALIMHKHLRILLVYSSSSDEQTIFYHRINDLMEKYHSRFTVEFIFSNTRYLEKSHLNPDMIESIVNPYSSVFDQTLFYICGPESYMRLCIFTLRRIRVPVNNIRKEIFDISKPVTEVAPPDTNPHQVTLRTHTGEYILNVQHPVTILKAARNAGINIPYSCETGRCGNCIAKCEKGKIWMSYNEVLTEKEIRQGYVLTCTGYPVEGDALLLV
jgi:ferredoxin-NADP reductase